MATISEMLTAGVQHYQAQRWREAEQTFRAVLQVDPSQFDALQLLGLVCNETGRADLAVDCLTAALRVNPTSPDVHFNLGVVQQKRGRFADAAASYRQGLRFKPGHAEAYFNLANALKDHESHAEAEAAYREAIRLKPGYFKAYNNLGNLFLDQGKFDQAVAMLREAVSIKPDYVNAYSNLGNALQQLGKPSEALAQCEYAVRLDPADPRSQNGLGAVLLRQKKPAEALACYQRARQLDPQNTKTLNNVGVALIDLARNEEALTCFQEALRLNPNDVLTVTNLGATYLRLGKLSEAVACCRHAVQLKPDSADAHLNLGVALLDKGSFAEQSVCFHEALRLKPDYAQAHTKLGIALRNAGKPEEAVVSHQRALALKPDLADAHCSLGVACLELGRSDQAVAAFQEAIRLKPDYVEAYNNLGMGLTERGQLDEAIAAFDHAMRLRENYADAVSNRALVHLLRGNYLRGWADFEWRWRLKEFPPRPFTQPQWDGSDLAGRTILLHAEQGLGDTLHFIRYAALVKERGGIVIAEVQAPLVKLLASCPGIDRLVAQGLPLPPFEVHVPLLSLPAIFRTDLATIPAAVPYVIADARLVEYWRDRLRAYPGFKIGVSWQGNPKHNKDRLRSIALAQFAPLAEVPNVHLISLQKGHGADQIRQVADRFPVIDLGGLDEANGPFMDTAAVMTNLDLVISSDTATAHLAGALGVPVWLGVTFAPDWRWLLQRTDTPWYPSMRLFRQRQRGDWAEVFERMARALREMAHSTPTIHVDVAPGELIDKITILEIKSARITDTAKLANIRIELDLLNAACSRSVRNSAELDALTADLKAVNEQLWDIEDAIRLCERDDDFGPRFIELARSVYRSNDRRAALKRRINDILGSTIVEEKSYASY